MDPLPPPAPLLPRALVLEANVAFDRASVRWSILGSMSHSPKMALEVVATNCLDGRLR
jgi:hypothetical protein